MLRILFASWVQYADVNPSWQLCKVWNLHITPIMRGWAPCVSQINIWNYWCIVTGDGIYWVVVSANNWYIHNIAWVVNFPASEDITNHWVRTHVSYHQLMILLKSVARHCWILYHLESNSDFCLYFCSHCEVRIPWLQSWKSLEVHDGTLSLQKNR